MSKTRVSSSTEKDGNELQKFILDQQPLRHGEYLMLIPLDEKSRKAMKDTALQMLTVIEDQSKTHMTLEIRHDDCGEIAKSTDDGV